MCVCAHSSVCVRMCMCGVKVNSSNGTPSGFMVYIKWNVYIAALYNPAQFERSPQKVSFSVLFVNTFGSIYFHLCVCVCVVHMY